RGTPLSTAVNLQKFFFYHIRFKRRDLEERNKELERKNRSLEELLTTTANHIKNTRNSSDEFIRKPLFRGDLNKDAPSKWDLWIAIDKNKAIEPINVKVEKKSMSDEEFEMILSSMPGSVVSVAVEAGDGKVVEGTEIVVVEAMKMQNILRASRASEE
ncbi:25_t:CDS:2, partial [Racocetra fulgida]